MPNEKEVKEAARRAAELDALPLLARAQTGRRMRDELEEEVKDECTTCPCESRLDPPTKTAVRWLRSARLYLDAAKVALDSATGGEELLVRKYPAPEIREVRRKVVTAIALIDEIGGEL